MAVSIIEETTEVIHVSEAVQGPAGPAGPDGATHVHAATFAAGDGSVSIGTVAGGNTVLRAYVEINTPFDGGAGVTVGKAGAPACLMTIAQNTPSAEGIYATTPLWDVGAETEFYLYLSGASTVGAGTVWITLG